MTEEKEIIDLCSSEEDEKEEDFADEETEDEDEETSSDEEDDDDIDWNNEDSDLDKDFDEKTLLDNEHDKVSLLLLKGVSDLKAVNVKDCKEYLRKNGLRLSGTKPVLIDRIFAHWRIKDGTGQSDFPKSSFVINCKGDVCKGDIVLFTQKVHHKYEKMKGSGKIMGRRTVAGKVIKESYGTAKQQHTFTIEVLWCEGIQTLPPLYPLLVKGRNLYRLMTLRQPWANEGDRAKVLYEKHSRGAAARKVMRERKIKLGYIFKDGRLQKPDHMKKLCQVKTRKNKKDENLTQRLVAYPDQNPSQSHKNPTQPKNMNPPFRPYNSHSNAPPRPYPPQPLSYAPPRSYPPPPRAPLIYAPRPHSHSYTYSTQQNQSMQRPPPAFYNGRPTSNAMWGQAPFNSRPNTQQRRPYQNNHASSNIGYNYGVRDLDHFSEMVISHRREGDGYKQSEDTRRPYVNHHANHYNGASHRTEGDTHRQNRESYTYRPNHR
ncbi:unnamed protein product [Cochlearia groenlandica]